jgi:hypothetical protein
MSFINTVREVIRLSSEHPQVAQRDDLSNDTEKMHTSGGNDSAEAYLKTLPDDVVMKLQALMFAGKDKHLNISRVYEELKPLTRDKDEAIRAMTSKVSVAEYLEKGLVIAEQHGLDLEAEF